MEHSKTFGLPTWASHVAPCIQSHSTVGNWFDYSSWNVSSLPWLESMYEDYDEACGKCEITVELTIPPRTLSHMSTSSQ